MEFIFVDFATIISQVNFGSMVNKATGSLTCKALIKVNKGDTKLHIENLPLSFSYNKKSLAWSIDTESDTPLDMYISKTGLYRTIPATVYVPYVKANCLTDIAQEFFEDFDINQLQNNTKVPYSNVHHFLTKLETYFAGLLNPSIKPSVNSADSIKKMEEAMHSEAFKQIGGPGFSPELLKKMVDANNAYTEALKKSTGINMELPANLSIKKMEDAMHAEALKKAGVSGFSTELLKKMEEANKTHTEALNKVANVKSTLLEFSNNPQIPSKSSAFSQPVPGFSPDLLKKMAEANKTHTEALQKTAGSSTQPTIIEKEPETKVKESVYTFMPTESTVVDNKFYEICKENGIRFQTNCTQKLHDKLNKKIDTIVYGVTLSKSTFMKIFDFTSFSYSELTNCKSIGDDEKMFFFVYTDNDSLVFHNPKGLVCSVNSVNSEYWNNFIILFKNKFTVVSYISNKLKLVENTTGLDSRSHVLDILNCFIKNWDVFVSFHKFVDVVSNKCDEFEQTIRSMIVPLADLLADAITKCRKAIQLLNEYNTGSDEDEKLINSLL